jgi:hypothetical protein
MKPETRGGSCSALAPLSDKPTTCMPRAPILFSQSMMQAAGNPVHHFCKFGPPLRCLPPHPASRERARAPPHTHTLSTNPTD